MRTNFWAAPLLGVVGGLLLLLASAAGWVSGVDARNVGGVTVSEPVSVSGTTYAPVAVALGLAGLAAGALLAVVRGRARRLLGAVVAGVGAAGLVTVAAGLPGASAAEGTVTPAPFLALAAAVAVAVAGAAALRGPDRPPAKSRYRVEGEQPTDDEWTLAADEDDTRS